jgi:hypothetical protein
LVAIRDVGAAPYYSQLSTLDISPEALAARHIGEMRWSTEYVFDREPGIVAPVSFSWESPTFDDQHRQRGADTVLCTGIACMGGIGPQGERCYRVYARADLPISDSAIRSMPGVIDLQA